jgi:hypothetical protein
MRRDEILEKIGDGYRVIVQDKVNGSVYCCIKRGNEHSRRIRFHQYIWLLDHKKLHLIEKTTVQGFDHCEYIGAGVT